MKTFAIAVLACSLTACISMSPNDANKLREIRAAGLSEQAVVKKNPGVAASLNILPGFGNFYLAAGTNESAQWTYGALNLLLWPISIVWGVPQAAIDAGTINKAETVYYYSNTAEGKKALEAKSQSAANSDK